MGDCDCSVVIGKTKTTSILILFNICIYFIQVEIPPSDLGATASLNETLSLLREVLSSHDASVVPLDARQGDYSKVCIVNVLVNFLIFRFVPVVT